jgi:dynactin complex subunit
MLHCVAYVTDARDWRARLDQMQKHRSGIDDALDTTKGQLDKLQSEISHTLEKISSREKYLNSQLEPLLVQYRALQVSSHYQFGTDHYRSAVTVGFSVLYLWVHCLHYRSAVK